MNLHLFQVQHSECVVKEPDLHLIITGGVCSHRWGGINFDQPRFQVGVKENIETVELKTVLVIDDGLLDRLEASYDHFLDLCERIRNFLLPVLRHEEEFHASKVPLATETLIIVL